MYRHPPSGHDPAGCDYRISPIRDTRSTVPTTRCFRDTSDCRRGHRFNETRTHKSTTSTGLSSQHNRRRDGLIVEQNVFKGLLLPQVPVEQGWDAEDFLSHTCMKAGLQPDAWCEKNTKISKFQGQIFTETKPLGPIKEIQLNGSNC